MKTVFVLSLLMSSIGVQAGGTVCRALCETHWGVKRVSEKGGDTYFSARDVFSLMSEKCYGRLVSGYQRDPYEPWYTRPVFATPTSSCQYDERVPSNYAPEYSGNGVGH